MAGLEGFASGLLSGANAFTGALRDREELAYKKALMERQAKRDELMDEKTRLDIQKTKKEMEEGPKPSQDQASSAGYLAQAEQAEQTLERLAAEGYDPTKPQTGKGLLKGVQSALETYAWLPEALRSPERKSFEQASNVIADASLRPKTGASITENERAAEIKTLLPQPGDSPDVLKLKAAARAQNRASLAARAGNASGRVERVASGLPDSGRSGLLGAEAKAADPQRAAAMEWLKQNPNDPRAAKIREKLGL